MPLLFIAITSTLFSIIQLVSALNFTSGVYQFVNRVVDPNGNLLAITDFGKDNTIMVTPLVLGQPSQLWTVTQFGTLSGVFTIDAPSSMVGNPLLAGVPLGIPGPLITVSDTNNTMDLWQTVQLTDGSFTLSDADKQTFWGLQTAAMNTAVQALNQSTNSSLQFWVAIRAS